MRSILATFALAITLIACGNMTPSGDIFAVTTPANGGLTGGVTTGSANLSIRGDCATDQTVVWDGDSWECGDAASAITVVTPAQLGGATNNWNVGSTDPFVFVRAGATTPSTVTGITGGANGNWMKICNVIGNAGEVITYEPITFSVNNGASTAGNQLTSTASAADITIDRFECVELVYDGTSSRWRAVDHYVDLTAMTSGTGTTNTIPKFTGAYTIGNSVITDDGAGLVTVGGGLTVSSTTHITGTFWADSFVNLGANSGHTISIAGTTNHTAPVTVQDFRGTAITPAAITGSVNNWNPTGLSTATTVVIATSGSVSLTGLAGGSAGRRIRLYNDGANDIDVFHNSASSSVGNKIILVSAGTSKRLGGNRGCSMDLEYRGSLWYEVGFTCSVMPLESVSTSTSATLSGNTTVQDFRGTRVAVTFSSSAEDNHALSATATILRITASTTTVNFSGMTGGVGGRVLIIQNQPSSTQLVILRHNTTSTAANRFSSSFGEDETLEPGYEAVVMYDDTEQRWRIVSKNGRFKNSGLFTGQFTAYSVAGLYGDTTFGDDTTDDFFQDTGSKLYLGDVGGNTITSTATGTQNDFSPTNLDRATIVYLNPATPLTITGIALGRAGRMLTLCNISTVQVQLAQDSGSSTAANRLYLPAGLALNIPYTNYWNGGNSRECVDLVYNGTSSRWMAKGHITSQAVFETTSQLYSAGTFSSIGAATFNANITAGNDADDLTTFSNGPRGVNKYEGKHFEWSEEWLNVADLSGSGSPRSFLTGTWSGAGTGPTAVVTTGRPGVMAQPTGTSGTGYNAWITDRNALTFDDGSYTFSATVAPDTLAAVGSVEYGYVIGFFDTFNVLNQVDGCYFLYDKGNLATAPGTGNRGASGVDKWECWCSQSSTRTAYSMDGTIVSDGSFTTVNAPLVAATYQRLEIRMTGNTLAEFYVNGVKSCQISTNLPTGGSEYFGAGHMNVNSVGTTSRNLYVDQTRLDLTLTSARNP